MRDALVAAAFRLFLERGYEQTTVDDIVTLAGVGRRSFFRYFPSKEDVVFPDHERCLADMTAFLGASGPEHEPVRRVCDAARLVLLMYAENPSFSVQRYRLTKQVPGLRAYELSVVWRYERALAEYLRGRFAGRRDGDLEADVIAAAVVAAHNNALRSWLRSDGEGEATATVDHALAYVQSAFGSPPAAPVVDARPDGRANPPRATVERPEDVVVVVARRGAPLWRVVQEIETTLGRD
ncbi:TetR family transcriptional regulator [Streptomyces hilarionis]|uniref:TetR family transcriptional regulator n=1 Tax=Streptomyces hilarionis TaxID=2839954 RepID=UPI00211A801F|nr:TetR family transcriptional regulator [Streptomyces hilarionis]MCQ9132976.1 TetR/AcrR family transcriptional regulator [Streptomyces hilarionis]